MSHLIPLRRRIRSIKTTQKITRAMRLISMSLYSKLDKMREPVEYHKNIMKDLFENLYKKHPGWENKLFFQEDILDSTPLFIVISSTKGFCGGLNNILFKYTEQKLFTEEHQEPEFLTIGKKATDFVKVKNFGPIVESYTDLNSNNFSDIGKNIAERICTQKPYYSSVTIYSSIFKNFFNQRPIKNLLIPIFSPETAEGAEKPKETDEESIPPSGISYAEEKKYFEEMEPIWEQDKDPIVDYVANQYLETLLTSTLFQALISEYAARFVAMDSATTNAENYLEALTLQFNKMRQALITREVSELSVNLL